MSVCEVKSEFVLSVFSERGALAIKKTYLKMGYEFVKSEVTSHKIFLTFK